MRRAWRRVYGREEFSGQRKCCVRDPAVGPAAKRFRSSVRSSPASVWRRYAGAGKEQSQIEFGYGLKGIQSQLGGTLNQPVARLRHRGLGAARAASPMRTRRAAFCDAQKHTQSRPVNAGDALAELGAPVNVSAEILPPRDRPGCERPQRRRTESSGLDPRCRHWPRRRRELRAPETAGPAIASSTRMRAIVIALSGAVVLDSSFPDRFREYSQIVLRDALGSPQSKTPR